MKEISDHDYTAAILIFLGFLFLKLLMIFFTKTPTQRYREKNIYYIINGSLFLVFLALLIFVPTSSSTKEFVAILALGGTVWCLVSGTSFYLIGLDNQFFM